MDSVADRLAGTGLFGDVVAAIRHAVVLMSSADGEPADPFRGLYITDDATLPLEDRPARVAERLVVALLGTDLRATAEDPVRVVRQPACPVGREDTVSRLRAMLADGGDLPLLVAGADAELVLAAALGT